MKRALVAAIAAALTTAAVLSASGLGATSTRKAKSKSHHAHRAGATGASGATGPWGGRKQSGPPPTLSKVLADMKARKAARDKTLADALGVSVEKLQSAFDTLEATALADAVKKNRLTQAEADAITACKKAPLTCDRSDLPAGGPGGLGGGQGGLGGGPGRFIGPRGTGLDDLAKELGVSTDKLKSALQTTRPKGLGSGGRGFRFHHEGGPGGGMGGDPPQGGPPPGGPQGGAYEAPPAATGTGV